MGQAPHHSGRPQQLVRDQMSIWRDRCLARRLVSRSASAAGCRLKRETERLQRELEQRDMEEALAVLKASKGGKSVKLKV